MKAKPKPTNNTVSRDLKYGRTLYPNGRVIDLMAPSQEWLDWAVQAILEAAKKERKP